MASETMREVVSLVKANQNYRHVLVRKALKSTGQYGLVIVDLLFDGGDVENVDRYIGDRRGGDAG
jgi:hypothetical protein